MEGTLGATRYGKENYENNITYHGSWYWQPLRHIGVRPHEIHIKKIKQNYTHCGVRPHEEEMIFF